MNPESLSPHLNLVVFRHDEDVCPVKQATPDSAEHLSAHLTTARSKVGKIPGAFLPPDHRGAALAAGDPEQVAQVFEEVLNEPAHEVEVFPLLEVDERLAAIAADPTLLEGSGEDAVANRTLLFETAHRLAPEIEFDESIANRTPSLSLVELESFLKERAHDIARRGKA